MDVSFKTYSPTLGGSRGIPFTNTVKNKFLRGVPTSLKNSVITLYSPDLRVGDAIIELRNPNAMGVIDSGVTGVKWWYSTSKGKVDVGSVMDSQVKAVVRIV